MPEILFIDLLKLLKEGVRTDRVRLSAGVSSTNRKPLKRQSMKTYCKTVDITDRKLIQKAVYKCLKKKYKRRDSLTMFSEYTGLPTNTIKGMFNEFGLNGMKPMVETVVDGVREEIIQGNIHFQPIWYREKIDASSQKVRRIGIQNIKQQIYDYIAVEAMKDFLRRIREYQCAALKGRGQSYGIKAIKRWMRNKDIRYAGQCDISKCYPSIDRNKLMEFLRKYIKNEPLLELIEMLIMTFDTGLSIGSYLSQYLCNLFLSQIYHEIAENMYRIRKKRNGTIERVNLVKHQLFFMDDILILGTNAKDIHKAMKLIIQKADEMGLKIKDSWTVYTTVTKRKDDGHFIDIMGVRIYRQHITIRRRVFLRVRRSYKKAQSLVKQRKKIPVWLARKCMSYKGILDHTDSYNIKRRYNANKTIQICKGVISHESKIRHYTRECHC